MSVPEVINTGYELVAVGELTEHPRNVRRGDLEAIKASIVANGFFGTLEVQRSTRHICAGNHRFRAAKELGLTHVPVVWLDVDDTEALRILLVDNRTNDQATYDEAALGALLVELRDSDDLLGSGYDSDELDELLDRLAEEALPEVDHSDDDVPEHMDELIAAHARTGDTWTIGEHRIVCGDSTDDAAWGALMAGSRADLVLTSPPYNVGVGYAEHDDRPGTWDSYGQLIAGVAERASAHLADGRAVCWNIPQSRHAFFARQVLALEAAGLDYWRTLIWHKKAAPFPQWANMNEHRVRQLLIDPMFEFVLMFTKGDLEKGPHAQLDDAISQDVFYVAPSGSTADLPAGDSPTGRPGAGSIGRARKAQAHPATFTVKLPMPFVTNLAAPGEIVVDPFLGAGTTTLAAQRLGRRCYGIELTPRYVDLALWRLQRETGELPQRDGVAHDFMLKAAA